MKWKLWVGFLLVAVGAVAQTVNWKQIDNSGILYKLSSPTNRLAGITGTAGYFPAWGVGATNFGATNIVYTDGVNVGLNVTIFGTSSSNMFALKNGGSPTTFPGDTALLGASDFQGNAGQASLNVFTEGGSRLRFGGAVGFLVLDNNQTDATIKTTRIGVSHYTNSEEPTGILVASSDVSNSAINFGGGSASVNAPMNLVFFTAANTTTTTGTERMRIRSNGITSWLPTSTQTLAAANPIVAGARQLRVAGSGGAVTLTATPTIADGSPGDEIMILGTDDTNTITVQDEGTLANSNVYLGAVSRVLGSGDVLYLTWSASKAAWVQISFNNN